MAFWMTEEPRWDSSWRDDSSLDEKKVTKDVALVKFSVFKLLRVKNDMRKKLQRIDFLRHCGAREQSNLRELYYRGWTFVAEDTVLQCKRIGTAGRECHSRGKMFRSTEASR